MKTDRLIGILTVLLSKKKCTAAELSAHFEVSRRTIHRDIDALCLAGIPVVCMAGGGGGISIMEGFKLDKSVLTNDELESILAGLRGLGSISGTSAIENLLMKLSPDKSSVISLRDSMVIDLSSYYKTSLSEKIDHLKSAIRDCRLVSFDYYTGGGSIRRTIEPYCIAFKWGAWYVFGYCLLRNDFRLFKLNRAWKMVVEGQAFHIREIPQEKLTANPFPDNLTATLLIDRSMEYRLVDEYGVGSYEALIEGKLKFILHYSSREYAVGWILGFGDKAKVLAPDDLAAEIAQKAKNMLAQYE